MLLARVGTLTISKGWVRIWATTQPDGTTLSTSTKSRSPSSVMRLTSIAYPEEPRVPMATTTTTLVRKSTLGRGGPGRSPLHAFAHTSANCRGLRISSRAGSVNPPL